MDNGEREFCGCRQVISKELFLSLRLAFEDLGFMKRRNTKLKILFTVLVAAFFVTMNAQKQVSLNLMGDIFVGNTFPAKYEANLAPSIDSYFTDVAPLLKNTDLSIANLEGPLFDATGKLRKVPGALSYSFKMPTRYACDLMRMGVNCLVVANNHSMDFGVEGQRSTINALHRAGITFAGFKGRYQYMYVYKHGLKIALCAFSHTFASPSINDVPWAVGLVKRLKQRADLVVVSFHGGAEGISHARVPFKSEVLGNEKRGDVCRFAHACIDAGASVVFGHGPHVPRAVELYRGHLVAYSLGNFCTPYYISLKGTMGCAPLLKIEMDEKGMFTKGHIYSFSQKRGEGPKKDLSCRAAKEIARLSHLDFPLSSLLIADDGTMSIIR